MSARSPLPVQVNAADFADELTRRPYDTTRLRRSLTVARRMHDPTLGFLAADVRARPFATGSCAGVVA